MSKIYFKKNISGRHIHCILLFVLPTERKKFCYEL